MNSSSAEESIGAIAVIGLSGRFPGADTLARFWENLRDGVEAISFFSDQQLESVGVNPALLSDPSYVKAGSIIDNIDLFDASFFGLTPREAEVTDPQHRLFLECAWEALENAGYDSDCFSGNIGVFAGVTMSSYLLNLYSVPDLIESAGGFRTLIGNDRDYLPTLVSYKLNLTGPSINVQTACSTSLVATHLACQSLLDYQCDMALAGGVSISVPQKRGYIYQEGGINSPDGHCRSFDARARGTIGGNGLGIVVLKRLEDALIDGDHIWAVIKGSAINNDGSSKIGYMAPSIDGQAKVIATAQALAGVEPDTITYVEAHGSATPLGDPIEVAALTKAFRASTNKKGFCALGSVKTNIGHLGAAAGVAGLIKTILAIKHGLIPPSLHFEHPNPEIDFSGSPFYVNARLSDWKRNGQRRRAGVSSFGIGGTNAHLIIEEAPETQSSKATRGLQLIVLSAKTESALEQTTDNFLSHLKQHSDLKLADAAYTFALGRRAFNYRRALVSADVDDTISAIESRDPKRLFSAMRETSGRAVVFMFPGLGDHYVRMGVGLYRSEPTFRNEVDRCAEILRPVLARDIRDILYPDDEWLKEQIIETEPSYAPASSFDLRKMLSARHSAADKASQELNQTVFTQPALFVIEYALARLWIEWGVRPDAMIGYSIGEYVAACLAGVFSLEDALRLIARRAQMIQEMEEGAMIAVAMSEDDLSPLLNEELSLAGLNGPALCVASGTVRAVEKLEYELAKTDIVTRRLPVSHAFHSNLMKPISNRFAELVSQINLSAPDKPYLSNVTGRWITSAEATNPQYWAKHLCQPVRFGDGIQELLKDPSRVFVEVGPGQMLTSLVIQQSNCDPTAKSVAMASIKPLYDRRSDTAFLLNTLAELWLRGVEINWKGFYAHQQRQRLPLPTYPFERESYWIEPQKRETSSAGKRAKANVADWFYIPVWEQSVPPRPVPLEDLTGDQSCWMLLTDDSEIGARICGALAQQNQSVVTVARAKRFTTSGDYAFAVNPREPGDWKTLLEKLRAQNKRLGAIIHLWTLTDAREQSGIALFDEAERTCLKGLFALAQALEESDITHDFKVAVVSNNMQDVTGSEGSLPEKATVVGFCKALSEKYPNISARTIDVSFRPESGWQEDRLIGQIISEVAFGQPDSAVAYRGDKRWVQSLRAAPTVDVPQHLSRLRRRGVYLIVGELEGIVPAFARFLSETAESKLALAVTSGHADKASEGDNADMNMSRVKALEELGAQVTVFRADLRDQAGVCAAVDEIGKSLGEIIGVIYAPNLRANESPEKKSRVGYSEQETWLSLNARALYFLESAFVKSSPDFFLIISSLAETKSALAHCSATAFFDAFALSRAKLTPAPWMSLKWDNRIPPDKSYEAIKRILSLGRQDQLIVSTSAAGFGPDISTTDKITQDAGESTQMPALSLHLRSRLRNSYAAPTNQSEQIIVSIWQELLGLKPVGIHDDFFQLGGDSLMGIRLTGQLRRVFNIDLPVRILVEAPTIAELASVVEEAILAEIEGMSGDETAGFN
ncbi:MAG: beta-ketoacyl synthase N-terminal-like domain-containing protein [Blastocatellia bacterium]